MLSAGCPNSPRPLVSLSLLLSIMEMKGASSGQCVLLLQGGVLGREGRTEACFSSLPTAHGDREAQRWWASITLSAVLFFSAWAGAKKLVWMFLFSFSSSPPSHSRTVS